MIKLVIVKNMFDPADGREIRYIDYPDGPVTVQRILDEYGDADVDMQATVNTEVVEPGKAAETMVNDDEMIVIYPVIGGGGGGGKNILGVVAAIALSVVAMGVGGYMATGVWGSFAGATAATAALNYMAAAAIMFLGSSLIGRMTATDIDTGSYDSTTNPTYSWNEPETMSGQNNPIQLTYGTVKSAGQTIGKYVNTLDNKEYLNWLIAVGEGPLTFSDIKINDNPVSYYTGMTVETRPGTNNQSVINNFNDTYFTKTLGYQLLTSARTDTAQGNATQGLIIKIEWSNGLYYAKDDGSLGTAWVSLHADYRLVGTSDWHNFIGSASKITSNYHNATLISSTAVSGNYEVKRKIMSLTVTDPTGSTSSVAIPTDGTTTTLDCGVFRFNTNDLPNYRESGMITVAGNDSTVSAAQSSALRREYRVDGLPSGEYEVQVYITGRSHDESNSRAAVKCYWTGLTSIVYDDFVYPGTALLSIRALATDQISGTPSISYLKTRATVLVWNPTTAAYESKDATNPAWAAYDYCHLATSLINIHTGAAEIEVRGTPASMMMYDRFAAWAEWCDQKNLKINLEVVTIGEMLTTVNKDIAPVGRGYVLPFGTKLGPIWDAAADPVQMFGMGNIIAGTFTEEFLSTTDRANCIELTYVNADASYTRDTVTIYDDAYDDADAVEKSTQVTYNGITSRAQAYREGKYLLACNKYLVRTVTFDASVDAIACTAGDLILVAHDVPKWAYSGRIYAVNGNVVTLPVSLTDAYGSWRLIYRSVNDVLYTHNCTVFGGSDGYTTVTVDAFSTTDPPQVGDVFDLGLINKGSKPFKIKTISRAKDFTRKITAIEYKANVYNENYSIPDIDYSMLENRTPQNVVQLSADQLAWKDALGTVHCRMYASWTLPQGAPACKFTVLLSTDGTNYKIARSGLSQYNVELDTTPNVQYWVKIISTLNGRASTGTVDGPISAGIDKQPPDVTALHHELMSNNIRRFWWDFEYPTPNDIAGFRLKYTPNGSIGWDGALPLHEGIVTSQPFETGMLRQGMATVLIKAVDNAGNESKNVAMLEVNLGDVLQENVLYTKDLAANSWADVTHDGYVDTTTNALHGEETIPMWDNPNSPMWDNPNNPMWDTSFKSFSATYQFTAPASGQFWMDLAASGPLNVTYSVNGGTAFPYTQKVMVSAGDIIKVVMTAFAGSKRVSITKATLYIDVPDVVEHFNDISVTTAGVELPVKCPNYYTVAVRIDAVENNARVWPQIVTRNPCVIKLYDATGAAVAGVVDVTWQGFRKKVI